MSQSNHMADVQTILTELNYPHRVVKVDETEFLTIGTQTKHFLLQIRLAVRQRENELYAVTHIPFKIPIEMMPPAFVVINEINSRLAVGCFFISMDMQSVFFRASFPFKEKIDSSLVDQLVSLAASTIDAKMPNFATKFLLDESFSIENLMKAKTIKPDVEPPSLKDKKLPLPSFRPRGETLH